MPYEIVGVLSLDSIGIERIVREILEVEGNDHLSVGADGGGKDVRVVRIGKDEALCDSKMSRYKGVGNRPIHQFTGALELFRR